MSRKFLNPLNLVNLPSDPASASEGDIYWNSSTNQLRIYHDGVWGNVGAGVDLAEIGIKSNNIEGSVSGIENTTIIDTADESIWRTLKYLLQVRYLNEVHSLEAIVSNDGTNLLISQYGDVYSNTALVAVTADKNNGIINLKVTPISGKIPISVRFFRVGIKV